MSEFWGCKKHNAMGNTGFCHDCLNDGLKPYILNIAHALNKEHLTPQEYEDVKKVLINLKAE